MEGLPFAFQKNSRLQVFDGVTDTNDGLATVVILEATEVQRL